ncbi:SDR family NAD(P)-dependent oxidoreductase [Advenella mimigardefordensis]|uniref:Putative oxidoreductase, SDR family n=1 Tax=Advenella mimigardefordensis (strain DSM 17166 / LMG 22922 / DPN7) TaxID=1247726 RepID=W0PKS3_ADVMD|nr:SDR family oxidoreductase [Advenella mimigardefordensis]AHG65593.1 putative oxidoreductase, SDR family [Advenella mimigardefordensis DPN7]
MSLLSGKTALVTGGSRGIGAAIVRHLAREGASVAFTYSSSGAAAQALAAELDAAKSTSTASSQSAPATLALQVDSLDPVAVQEAVSTTAAHFGKLDILVNNAGIFELKPTGEFTLDDYERQMGVNARAVFAAIQRAAQVMTEGGRIINIGSNLAEKVPSPGMSLYAMSKAAVWGLTKGAARDLGPRGITVNIIQPGSTDTDMNPASGPHAEGQRGLRAIDSFNKPEEIASMAVYLASDAARSITGASLLIDGGANV